MSLAALRQLQAKEALSLFGRAKPYWQGPIVVQADAVRVLSSNADAPRVMATMTANRQKMPFTIFFLTDKRCAPYIPTQLMWCC